MSTTKVVPAAVAPASEKDRGDAVLLSRFFYDEGLLALPAEEVEPRLNAEKGAKLKLMQGKLSDLKKVAEAIQVPMAHSLADGKVRDLPVYLQGNPAKHGPIAKRGMPAVLTAGRRTPFQNSEQSGRLQLAEAVASPQNPLTARVIVNRIWAQYFGHGLVRTTSNFGKLGERPTHPELLDYLAVSFMEQGWSLKWLHRQILMSSTYRQSSQFVPHKYERDPENRYLWRMNRRRLPIESWRDSLLAVSGELDRSLGGPSQQLSEPANKRRTLYGFVSRHQLDELLRLFDFPDPNITASQRTVTTVPLQQLFVLNSEFMVQRAKALNQRLQKAVPDDSQRRIQHAFQLLFARTAEKAELKLAGDFLMADKQQPGLTRWEQLCLAMLSSNEFLFVD